MSMTCDQFRDLLIDHVEGELIVEVQELFEIHRSRCPNCGAYLDSYHFTIRITRKLPGPPLPADVEARLRESLRPHLGGGD